MNFTPWETISQAIAGGAKYWSVYDSTGKRLIFENNSDDPTELSAEKLHSLLSRETGEFVQIRLAWKSNQQKAEGGNTRGFTYYFKLANPAPGVGGVSMPGVSVAGGAGVPLHDYVAALNKQAEAERERLRLELTAQKEPSILERIATPENIDQVLQLGKALVQAFANRAQPIQANQVSGSPFDQETTAAVQTLLTFQDGKAALVNIANAGPLVWAAIHQGLTENKLIP